MQQLLLGNRREALDRARHVAGNAADLIGLQAHRDD